MSTKRRRFLVVAICCAILGTAAIMPITRSGLLGIVNASDPATSNTTVPSTAGQTITVTWAGSIPPLTNATSDCAALADTPTVDQHVSTVNVPNGLYNAINAKFTFTISWPNPDNDEILTVIKPDGTTLDSSDGGTPSETVVGNNLAAGAYKIIACGFISGPDAQPYTGTLTIETLTGSSPSPTPMPAPTPVVPGAARYHEYAPPAAMGENAGEPTLGFNPISKRVMYIAGLQTLRVTFPENREPLGTVPEAGPALWEDVSFIGTSKRSLDPILFTDHRTSRTFVSQLNSIVPPASPVLIGLNSLMAYSDDDGASWIPAQLNPPDGSYDHQTVGAGPYPASLSVLSNQVNKGSAVYYCAQVGVSAFCSRSDNGGLNFGRAVPTDTAVSSPLGIGCSAIHGHVKVAPDGTVYLPHYNCGGKQGVAVSTDAGTTWTVRQIPGSLPPAAATSPDILDPSIAISRDAPVAPATSNTIYFAYTGKQPGGDAVPVSERGDDHVYVAVSKDRGITWSTPVDIGASVGVKNAVFASAVAGDSNRAAVAFVGATTSGDHQSANFKGVWYGFVAHTYDGGQTWTTVNATPNGPVQREACIWNGGGNNPCRNLLDFNDATVDDKGRVLFSFADGCIDGCETGGPNSYSAKATISRQSGGKGLFAQFDTPEPALPQRPYLTGRRDDMASYLSWAAPDNGGSAITAYKIYRTGGGGTNLLVGQTTGNDTTFNDRSGDVAIATYTYTVKAVNMRGESPSSNEVSLVVGPRTELTGACELPGMTVISDPVGDASDTLTQHDITSVSMAEPDNLAGKLVFTIKVVNLSTIPPGWRWSVRFGVPGYGPPEVVGLGAQEDWFVSMTTSDGPTPTFTYGTTGGSSNVPARLFTTLGSLDGASNVTADGTITLVLSKEVFRSRAVCSGGCGPLNPGQPINLTLGSVRATAPSAISSAGGTNETIPDTTGAGTYVLRTPTLCLPNTAPVARLTADVDDGIEPLTVNFSGSDSYDVDTIDSIATYTFNFGDGGDDVTQSSPRISHTYAEKGEYIARLVVTDSRGKVSSNTAQFHIDVEDATPTPTPTPTPAPTPVCIEDNDERIAYSGGWHLINQAAASGGHFRYHTGNNPSHGASLDFTVPQGNSGSISYSFAKSPKGGQADIYLDGVLKQTINYGGSVGSTQAPEFKPDYKVQYTGLAGGNHKLEMKNMSGVVYVDGFCLENSSSNAQPTSGPGSTTNASGGAAAGQTSSSNYQPQADSQEMTVTVESSLGVPFKVVLVDPSGLTLQTVDSVSGIATVNAPVNQQGIYVIKVVNVSLGSIQFTTTTTPLVRRSATNAVFIPKGNYSNHVLVRALDFLILLCRGTGPPTLTVYDLIVARTA